MARRYTVHVEGVPVEICSAADVQALAAGQAGVVVDGAASLEAALAPVESGACITPLRLVPAPGVDLWRMFRDRFEVVEAAGGLVRDADDRLLVIHRLGRWDLPKGKLEPGEAAAEGALREVREECGLRTLQLEGPLTETWHTYVHKGRRYLKRTFWFRMRGDASEALRPQQEEAITDVRWAPREEAEILKKHTYASLLPVFDAWAAGR
jgi:8-oxo-dGTP pyrophosphatase MutT (NUDIX family)